MPDGKGLTSINKIVCLNLKKLHPTELFRYSNVIGVSLIFHESNNLSLSVRSSIYRHIERTRDREKTGYELNLPRSSGGIYYIRNS